MFDFAGRCLRTLLQTTLLESICSDIASATGATDVRIGDSLQELWGGYGGIVRIHLSGTTELTAILKLIEPPQQAQHPRGWNTANSHQRKIRSYQIESHWYENYANLCNEFCRVPFVIATGHANTAQWILMEDLSAQFPVRASSLSVPEASVCLQWLAAFHARFVGHTPSGLWPIGTYWHLDTREDELNNMPDGELRACASRLDKRLKACPYQSIVHGDAKVANFCFNADHSCVAAVDFQYVGGGVGIKDVAYFLGSCLDNNTLERCEPELLSIYFTALTKNIAALHSHSLAEQVEQAWADLYAIAWTDFYRFLEGWMPGHTKINRYTKKLATRAFNQLCEQ